MMLADELLYLSEQDKWSRRLEFTRGLDSIPSTRYAPDFNCTTVEKYLNGGTECTSDEKVLARCIIKKNFITPFDSYNNSFKAIYTTCTCTLQTLSFKAFIKIINTLVIMFPPSHRYYCIRTFSWYIYILLRHMARLSNTAKHS